MRTEFSSSSTSTASSSVVSRHGLGALGQGRGGLQLGRVFRHRLLAAQDSTQPVELVVKYPGSGRAVERVLGHQREDQALEIGMQVRVEHPGRLRLFMDVHIQNGGRVVCRKRRRAA